jgi:hypothetical protein
MLCLADPLIARVSRLGVDFECAPRVRLKVITADDRRGDCADRYTCVHRRYSEGDLHRIELISKLRVTGMPAREIPPLRRQPTSPCSTTRSTTTPPQVRRACRRDRHLNSSDSAVAAA